MMKALGYIIVLVLCLSCGNPAKLTKQDIPTQDDTMEMLSNGFSIHLRQISDSFYGRHKEVFNSYFHYADGKITFRFSLDDDVFNKQILSSNFYEAKAELQADDNCIILKVEDVGYNKGVSIKIFKEQSSSSCQGFIYERGQPIKFFGRIEFD